ncbi:hypothetical protein J2Z48_002944 [Croceifilum oryzae]|uniref:DUF932 domain-containing protein n=1 Tax=Croceifilum oryzae TaxID=1553429 RepID=A0AAJ1TPU1_9BACL|nr:DUF932 domain-containing protein [Croceifilum oryzae]MDQ0418740.1 hypothetical protein [Croceifilum oryzae]
MNTQLQVKNNTNELHHILTRLENESTRKEDLIIPARNLMFHEDGFIYDRSSNKIDGYVLNEWATGQFAQKTNIPSKYFRQCPPELKAVNANHWIKELSSDEDWMLRTMRSRDGSPGVVRGIMSDKYVPFDDIEILNILDDVLAKFNKDYEIEMWNRGDTGCHLRVTFPDLTTSVGKLTNGAPDIHRVGFHMMNSEVGKSSIRITPMVYRMICTNGLMGWDTNGDVFQQRHIYLNHDEISNRVTGAIGKALKLGDNMINDLLKAKETEIENPYDVIDQIAKDNKYSQKLTGIIHESFDRERGNTAFHVVQALTLASQTLNADSRTEMERKASQVLNKLVVGL